MTNTINLIKSVAITVVFLFIPLLIIAQSANQNYVLKRTYKDDSAYFDDIQYYDGLGRPEETVQKQFTPASKDLVSRTGYDACGRENKQWLPAPNTKSDGTYNGSSPSFYNDTYPYSETVFEQSPLNRIQNRWEPGANWRSGSGHKLTMEYLTNKTADANLNCVKYFSDGEYSFKKDGNYADGLLYVTKTTDENGNISYEFKDKSDKLLLQRRLNGNAQYDTYYLYDDFGRLRLVFPPAFSEFFVNKANNSYSFFDASISSTLFSIVYFYYYDKRSRIIGKRLPGKDNENCAYDKADRMIMEKTADGALIFHKYDALGREILSGLYKFTGSVGDTIYSIQQYYANYVLTESASSTGNSNFYYTWNSFPALAKTDVTHVNFYDTYTYATDNNNNLNSQTKAGYGTPYSSAKGMLTGTWDKLLDGSGWIKTTYYYDAWGNLVQKRSTNQKGGNDYEYYAYNYKNQVKNKYTEHTVTGQSMVTEEYTYTYNDPRLRLTSVSYKINAGTSLDIAAYQYNDLGQVKEKKTGGGKETATFKYNLRGWETEQAGQRFSENLYYESNHPKSGSTVYWNGNVSAWTWKPESNTATVRGYSFKYNALGWLLDAVYGEGANLSTGTQKYDEYFTYNEKADNIKTLKRSGLKDNNTYGLIDDLNVTEYLGNYICKVTDAAGNQASSDVMEFKYNSDPVNDGNYFYYSSGALMADYHKRICMIQYNYLTLPQSVQFRKGDRIEYIYDAAGVKRKETHKVANRDLNYPYWSKNEPAASDFNTSMTVTTDYIGNKVYVNNQLKYVLTEEGYMEKAAGSNTFNAFYYLNDHLGNRRIVIDASGSVKQVNNYYPSGTLMAERRTDQGVQPYKFGGKELDRTNNLDFYDFDARSYNPILMRFTRPDPMEEKYYSMSPYAYCGNNPVNRIDPTGLIDYKINEYGYIYDSSSLWDKIKRLWNGPDKTDRLIAPNGNSLTMSGGTMKNSVDKRNDQEVIVGQSFKVESSDVAEQIHEFLSENVKKEYGVVDDVKNGVSTSIITQTLFNKGSNNASEVAQNLLQSGADVIQVTHNHPIGSDPTPSGYKPGQLDSADKDVITLLNKRFPNNFIIYRVYDPKNKVYIYYDANKIYKTEPKKH